MILTLNDLLQRFAITMDDFDPAQRDTWALAEVTECMQRIGVAITSEKVTLPIRMLPGNLLPLPTDCLRWYTISTQAAGVVWTRIRKQGKMLLLTGFPCNHAYLTYDRMSTDENGDLYFDALLEPALFAWLKWRWMELRPMKDQVGELRKGSLGLVQQLQRNAEDAVAEVRGQINLGDATPTVMAGLGSYRGRFSYNLPRR